MKIIRGCKFSLPLPLLAPVLVSPALFVISRYPRWLNAFPGFTVYSGVTGGLPYPASVAAPLLRMRGEGKSHIRRVWASFFCALFAASPILGLAQQIIPYPNSYEKAAGDVSIPKKEISISSRDREFAALIPGFSGTAKRYFGLTVKKRRDTAFVELRRSRDLRDQEAYRIILKSDKVIIEAGFAAGCFYGLQSILQLISNPSGKVRTGVIEDSPRYEWRGLMLDEARHFFGTEQVKSILDFMALHKLNRFHWHLTDTSGWRIEIKKYPLLTKVGGVGNSSDPAAPARYYRQEEVRQIVQYARERFIEVIPEIDMPGHAAAAVKAYPEFSGGGSRENPDFTFNPGKEGTYRFLTDILSEVAALFPSRYIHIGGDEVRLGNAQWGDLPEVRQMMKDQKLTSVIEVEHVFLRRMAAVLKNMGKTVVVWDEALDAELSNKSTVVMWWRHNRPQVLNKALDEGYQVVMCPRIPLYFDFVQQETHTHGRKWDRDYVPIESVYDFPAPQFTGNVSIRNPLIKGIQANLWTDAMHTPERLQFMLYPRLSALAEAAWTREESKDWNHFNDRMKSMLEIWKRAGIRYYDYTSDTDEIPGPRKRSSPVP